MIDIQMGISTRPDKVTDTKVADLGNHMGKKSITGNVKRYAQEHIGTTLIKLARQFAILHKKLEQGMARR